MYVFFYGVNFARRSQAIGKEIGNVVVVGDLSVCFIFRGPRDKETTGCVWVVLMALAKY